MLMQTNLRRSLRIMRFPQSITHLAQGVDGGVRAQIEQLLAQKGDIGFHIVVLCVGIRAPNAREQLSFGTTARGALISSRITSNSLKPKCTPCRRRAGHRRKGSASGPQILPRPAARRPGGEKAPAPAPAVLPAQGFGHIVVRTAVQPVTLLLSSSRAVSISTGCARSAAAARAPLQSRSSSAA